MGQTKSAGSSSHSKAKTQLLQAYFFMISPLTVAAQAGEGQLTAFHLAVGAIGSKLGGHRNFRYVDDRIAVAADKVNVGFDVGIEAFRSVDGGDACDAALFFEKGQISVDGCLRDVRMGFLKHLMYHLCRGVVSVFIRQLRIALRLRNCLVDASIGTSLSFICD